MPPAASDSLSTMSSSVKDQPSPGADAPAPGEAPEHRQQHPKGRLRGAMIVNPYSSGITSRRERDVVTTLREHVDLDVRRTERSGHATRLAQELIEGGDLDLLIACGGDGTANEALNGMSLHEGSADSRPAFAIVPAGGTNVLSRSIGHPNHPVRAARTIVDAIAERRTRTINLATLDERIFMFAAGVGLDAEVVKRMEARRAGRRPSDAAHVASIVGIYASSRFALGDSMTITVRPSGEQLRGSLLLVGNTTPMTYMGRMPMHFMPDCTLEGGLDFMAPRRANALLAMRNAMQAAGLGRRLVKPDTLQLHHDVEGLDVECDEPLAVQADGEYLGDRTHIRFGLMRRAVRLVG